MASREIGKIEKLEINFGGSANRLCWWRSVKYEKKKGNIRNSRFLI